MEVDEEDGRLRGKNDVLQGPASVTFTNIGFTAVVLKARPHVTQSSTEDSEHDSEYTEESGEDGGADVDGEAETVGKEQRQMPHHPFKSRKPDLASDQKFNVPQPATVNFANTASTALISSATCIGTESSSVAAKRNQDRSKSQW
ncbi:hypothetical protein BT69DRAFT_1282297 [Atractiella rhizophila]|nr:hypothetical protein BT69DRAFT_1282297 [Atractiella rhizophila]